MKADVDGDILHVVIEPGDIIDRDVIYGGEPASITVRLSDEELAKVKSGVRYVSLGTAAFSVNSRCPTSA